VAVVALKIAQGEEGRILFSVSSSQLKQQMQEYCADQGLQQPCKWGENMVSNPFGQVNLSRGSYCYL